MGLQTGNRSPACAQRASNFNYENNFFPTFDSSGPKGPIRWNIYGIELFFRSPVAAYAAPVRATAIPHKHDARRGTGNPTESRTIRKRFNHAISK